MSKINPIPIIAIDGTSSSGKGTIASILAKKFNYNYLNSGALYRLSAHLAIVNNIDIHNPTEDNLNTIVSIILKEGGKVSFVEKDVYYNGHNIWPLLASQEMGNAASLIAPHPPLRHALYTFQRAKIVSPGLVAEGRDMTTEVFEDAHEIGRAHV